MTNQTQATDPNDQNVVEFGDSPGRRLRVQRQSRGLAIERIAAQLHLKPEIIEALEQDRFDLLPDPVFIAGYLRNYARMLGIDPTPLISAYQAHAGTPKRIEPHLPIPGSDLDSGGTRVLVRLVSLALAAAVVAMIALWWHERPEVLPELSLETTDLEQNALARDTDPRPVDGSAPEVVGEAPEAAAGSEDRANPDRIGLLESPEPSVIDVSDPGPEPVPTALARPASDRLPEAAPSTTAEPPTEAETPEPTPAPTQASTDPGSVAQTGATVGMPARMATKGIVIEFSGPSWLEVRDAAGQRLIAGEMKAGDRREVSGQAPFRLTVGRVSNSSMTVDGKPFDLASRLRGDVARFSLDPESPE